jgi:hypothetical protein
MITYCEGLSSSLLHIFVLIACILIRQVHITLTLRMMTLWGYTRACHWFCIRNLRGFTTARRHIFQDKCIYIYRLSRATRPAHLIFLDFIIVTIFDEKYKLWIFPLRNFARITVTVPWVQVFPQNMFGDV